jgi:eukaryotic-like serine/threonine-protein kinase
VIGQILGHCRVVAKIGEGGMGVVYRAYDEVLHRDVAVKVVNKSARIDSSASQRLLHEARASSSLSHPNICTIHEVGESNGELYIVMELVEGKSLHAMSGDGGLPPESVLRYGAQIASALTRAHDRGIVHRDLMTANIVVAPDGLGASARAHQCFHWKREFPVYGGDSQAPSLREPKFRSSRQWGLRKLEAVFATHN